MKNASGSGLILTALSTLVPPLCAEELQRGVEMASLEPTCGDCQKAVKPEVGPVRWFADICAGFPQKRKTKGLHMLSRLRCLDPTWLQRHIHQDILPHHSGVIFNYFQAFHLPGRRQRVIRHVAHIGLSSSRCWSSLQEQDVHVSSFQCVLWSRCSEFWIPVNSEFYTKWEYSCRGPNVYFKCDDNKNIQKSHARFTFGPFALRHSSNLVDSYLWECSLVNLPSVSHLHPLHPPRVILLDGIGGTSFALSFNSEKHFVS